jgi:Zn-dependent protease
MSFAGPAANLLLAAAMFLLLWLGRGAGWFEIPREGTGSNRGFLETLLVGSGGAWVAVAKIASVLLSMNLLLGVLNLIPIPPLDGAGVAEGLLPRPLSDVYRLLRTNPTVAIVGIMIVFYYAGGIIMPLLDWTARVLRA